ncbi:hypothetical protein EV426DRAFT_703219 [Tirmania nivea]|nr:hypothetical protein EV426DRAFT_703219 [Tirmania nivea]
MNSEDVKQIVSWLQQPPAFQFPPTVNGNIPTTKFIKDRKAQLGHLVNELGCLPLQHHIPGIRLWLQVDPSDGGGFGFSLDLDTVIDFVKYTARTTGTLVQSRVNNDQKFMKWVSDRVSVLPLEQRRCLGFDEPRDTIEAAQREPSLRRRSTRIQSGAVVAVVPTKRRGKLAADHPRTKTFSRENKKVTFMKPFATNSEQSTTKGGSPSAKSSAIDAGTEVGHVAPDEHVSKRYRGMLCDNTRSDKTYKGKDSDLLDIATDAIERFRKPSISNGTDMVVHSTGTLSYRNFVRGALSKENLKPNTENAKLLAKIRPCRKSSTGATTKKWKLHGSIGERRSSRVTAMPTVGESLALPDTDGLMHMTLVYDGRMTTFLAMVQDMEGVESTMSMTATIIDVGVRAEYYDEVYGELSRTLGVASISSSPNI